MGQSDIIAKQYIGDNDIFADLFNFVLYDGNPVLKASSLYPLESSFTMSPPTPHASPPSQRFYDRLIPVITAVIFFSPDTWDGPTQLHDLLDIKDSRLLPMIENYKIHLIAPSTLTNDKINKFRTNLREVLSFIKYSKDKNRLKALISENSRFANLDSTAAMLLQSCTHSIFNIPPERKDGTVNMCKALDDLCEESRQLGFKAGIESGQKDGFIKGQLTSIQNLMETLQIPVQKALEMLKVPSELQEQYIAIIKNEQSTINS